MRNLKKITDDYLSKATDFAVQIVGNWGYGKTYYYRHTLEELIYNKPTYNDTSKNYKPIYVSLFGLKSIEDIATKIVLDFYQSKFFKDYFKRPRFKKGLKITQSVLKIGLRGFLNFKRLGNANDYLTDIKEIGKNTLDTNELVICFDDLERRDTSLNIEDLTGYINSMVDEGIKVLIISNEDLLLKTDDKYKNLKEKIIGITIEFIPNTRETLENIINQRYNSFPVYANYLKANIEDLAKLSQATTNNFRHIIYALDSLHHCYSIIRKDVIDNNHVIKEKVIEELKNISILTLALSVEYKASALKYNDLKDYKNISFHELLNKPMVDTDNKEEKKSKLELLRDKYSIQTEQYHFYESIYNYVTGNDEFSIDNFIIEFKKEFNLEKGKVLPQYEILNALGYQNCFSLSDVEYKEKTLTAIEYAASGKYELVDYLTLMYYAERFDNVLDLNLEDIKNKLVAGLRKVIENMPSYTPDFSRFEMSGDMSKLSEINKQLYDEGMAAFKQFEERKTKEISSEIVDLLISNTQEFQNRYNTDVNFKSQLSLYPFLNYLEPEMLLAKMKKTDGETLFFLRHFFNNRYQKTELLKQEFQNLKKITELLIQYKVELSTTEGQKIRNAVINMFVNILLAIQNKGEKLFEQHA